MSKLVKETIYQKEKRLKAREQSFSMSYKKGVFYRTTAYKNLIDYLKQPDVLVRVLKSGYLNDDTCFITITIEGFKASEDGI